MTVALRPHHLLCLLTYSGEGYNSAFVANFDSIAERIGQGEDIHVVCGPDDICAVLLDEPDCHCLEERARERDRLAAVDIEAASGQAVDTGGAFVLDVAALGSLRRAFSRGAIRKACRGCEWEGLCTRIAKASYARAVIR
ncbi:MAG: DUF1284 domain-containing protein [Hyphomicrobiales bacterium]